MVRNLLAGVGLLSIVLVSAVALRASEEDWFARTPPPSMAVSYSGLDLSTTPGIAAIEGRIGDAIVNVCGNDQDCRRSAYIGTRPQVARAAVRAAGPMHSAAYIGAQAVSIEPQLLDLSTDEQRRVTGPLEHAFEIGAATSWWAWPKHGHVRISSAAYYGGVECRNVSITQSKSGNDLVMAEGLRCVVPGLLPKYRKG